ncbi:MAG TPA: hypothetical protein DEP35_23010 [Deltaproteobacteria bacterium]|jgi:hypothetical protein|nr:hypothetical protein [Deltaproteobacteria bacterium]
MPSCMCRHVHHAVHRLARRLDAASTTFPTFGASEQTGRPHVECLGNRFDLVTCERGTELERRSTEDPHVLLYWIFKGITFSTTRAV